MYIVKLCMCEKNFIKFFFLTVKFDRMIIIVTGDKMKKIIFIILIIFIVIIGVNFIYKKDGNQKYMINLIGMNIEEIRKYSINNNLELEIVEEYSDYIEKGKIIKQSILENTIIKQGDKLEVYVSLGKIGKEVYQEYNVNELGRVPIMMYHGIHDVLETDYIGGNVDKDGYQRTVNAFRQDLEFYYNSGYRMISLSDYIDGKIDVPLGKSPIILTFDDGLKNNILVTGLDENGEIIIDPNSAVGILESFKEKYPDYNVTATFFLNGGLFGQPQYNEKIIKWLINNGYSIGNHSYSHANFSNITKEQTINEIGRMYQMLENIIPEKYVKIVALPFGSPYSQTSDNFSYILNGVYNNLIYETVSTLRVGWESEVSPFNKNFNKNFLKRIRAYDNNGKDFDIEMNFKILENNRYISDGNINTIVIPEEELNNIIEKNDYQVITY
ncbi:MAG: PASTA domain-containing protein [Firmicutes bacterium]|nr:PASTA domain-containing protein [Bacillota bacterium]